MSAIATVFLAIFTLAYTIAVIWTLVYLNRYTKATELTLAETKRSVKLQEEQIGLEQQPIVSIECVDFENFYFQPEVVNLTFVHAKIRIKMTVRAGDYTLLLPERHPYNGQQVWPIQAKTRFRGNVGLQNLEVDDFEGSWERLESERRAVFITFEWRTIRHMDEDSKFSDPKSFNPVAQWVYDWNREVWVTQLPVDGSRYDPMV